MPPHVQRKVLFIWSIGPEFPDAPGFEAREDHPEVVFLRDVVKVKRKRRTRGKRTRRRRRRPDLPLAFRPSPNRQRPFGAVRVFDTKGLGLKHSFIGIAIPPGPARP